MERQLRMGGGIMSLEPRQQFLFGGIGKSIKKAVKGVAKGVKNFAKSDVGKMALLAAGAYYAPVMFGGTAGLGAGSTYGNFARGIMSPNLIGPMTKAGSIGRGISSAVTGNAGMIGASLLGGVLGGMTPQEQEQVSGGRNIEALRSKLTKAYTDLQYDPAKIPDLVANDLSEYTSGQGGYADGGRIGYADGSEDMILPMRKPEIEQMMFSNPGAAESGNPISRNNPVADLIDKYNTYKKAMPGVADSTKKYLIEDFKESLDNSGISMEEFNMRLQEQNEMDEPVDMAYGGRMGYQEGATEMGMIDPKKVKQAQSMIKIGADASTISSITGLSEAQVNQIQKSQGKAYGGRIGYAFGTPEQNAIQAAGIEGLPLNQNPAGVTELDLRETGGFIPPVGVKEKADDIPAMLANNEFVFTADAVRGMGEGNVNKGAQRMYDMMKKLEKGGRV